jgi:hypothetical protein
MTGKEWLSPQSDKVYDNPDNPVEEQNKHWWLEGLYIGKSSQALDLPHAQSLAGNTWEQSILST